MLPAIAVDALRRQRERQAIARDAVGTAWQDRLGLCFADAVGRTLSPTVVSADFREVVDGLSLPVLLGAGVALKVVSEALGHTSIAVTGDIYSHVTPALAREAADGLDRALR